VHVPLIVQEGVRACAKANGMLCTAACGQSIGLFSSGSIDVGLDTE
jgi:hypothetical protein